MYTFKSLNLKNYFLYSNQKIPLNNQGLVIVSGKWDRQGRSNASGKSLMFSGIPFLGYSEFPTGKSKVQTQKDLNLSLSVSDNKDNLNIMFRDSRYTIKKNKQDITSSRKEGSKKLVHSMFPDISLLYSTCFVTQSGSLFSSLLEGTPAIRSKVLSSFLDFSKILEMRSVVNDAKTELDKKIVERDLLQEDLQLLTDDIKSSKKVNLVYIQELEKKETHLHNIMEVIMGKISKEEAKLHTYMRFTSLKHRLKTSKSKETLKEEIKTLRHELADAKKYNKVSEFIKIYTAAGNPLLYSKDWNVPQCSSLFSSYVPEEQVGVLIKKVNSYQRSLSSLRITLKGLKTLTVKDTDNCPLCTTQLSQKHLKGLVKEQVKKIDVLEDRLDECTPKIQSIKAWVELSASFKLLGIVPSRIQDISLINKEVKKNKTKLTFYEEQLEIVTSLSLVQVKGKMNVRSVKSSIERLKLLSNKKRAELKKVSAELVTLKVDCRLRQDRLILWKKKKEKWKELATAVKKDFYLPLLHKAVASRKLQADIMFGFCEFLVEGWNAYAPSLFDPSIRFKVGKDRGFPSFNYAYGKKAPMSDIRFLCGGERKRFILLTIPSIISVSPFKSNLLILDELDANVDEEGTQQLLDFIPEFQRLGKNSIFFITAKSDLHHDKYDEWQVVRKGNVSHINFKS